jgi:hypothetical protein
MTARHPALILNHTFFPLIFFCREPSNSGDDLGDSASGGGSGSGSGSGGQDSDDPEDPKEPDEYVTRCVTGPAASNYVYFAGCLRMRQRKMRRNKMRRRRREQGSPLALHPPTHPLA